MTKNLLLFIITGSKPKRKGKRKSISTSSTNSTISASAIEQIIERLKFNGVRDSTRRNYHVIWKIFNKFFIKLDVKPDNWEDRLTLFVGYLIENGKQSQTVKSYVSAIHTVLREDGFRLDQDQFLLSSLTRACKLKNDVIRTRLPIQKALLNSIIAETIIFFRNCNQPYLEKLYTALFATTYIGLFRIGELTAGSHPILVTDVRLAFNKQKLLFILRSSKTHDEGSHPQKVKIQSTMSNKNNQQQFDHPGRPKFKICPYTLINNFIKVRPGYDLLNEPFYVFSDNSPVSPDNVRRVLRTILQICGEEPTLFGFHSFRIGHSRDLLKLGLTVESIMKIGHWKSNAVYAYLR